MAGEFLTANKTLGATRLRESCWCQVFLHDTVSGESWTEVIFKSMQALINARLLWLEAWRIFTL